jgi:ferredoxin--NADP+ reductase
MHLLGTTDRPLRVAIIGSGPAGFFAAEPLLKSHLHCAVDMFDRLPVPFGLVRGGVAPDHPKIRGAARAFEKLADNPRFAFLGNVTVGRDVSLDELRHYYDAVVLATGAEADRPMGIPGEGLPGCHAAFSFVGWYNAHPDFADCTFDLSQETAVVVGAGNVALDVARILLTPVDQLRHTDIARHALAALAESRVREVHIIGRRGPAQVKFALAEMKEMAAIPGCAPAAEAEELLLDDASAQEIDTPDMRRIMQIFGDCTARISDPPGRRVVFRFLLSPRAVQGSGRVQSAVFERNRLVGPPFRQHPQGTGNLVEIPCGLLFRSIGYQGVPIPGLPFSDQEGIIPNTLGRVEHNGRPMPGIYAAGWFKRGPSGQIGTNKPDGHESAKALLSDAATLPPCPEPDSQALRALLGARGVRVVSFGDWRRIDAAEKARGAPAGKPRERFCRVADMLAVID